MTKTLTATLLIAFVIPPNPQSAIEERFKQAVELQRRGSLKEAEAEYRTLLGLSPSYAEAHANLGSVLMRLGRYEEAISYYDSALRLSPKLVQIWLNLGIAYYRRGEFEKAIEALKSFLNVSPENLQAKQLIGLSLVELGRDKEAVRFLTQSLAGSPDDPAVLYGLGLAYVRLRIPDLPSIVERLAALEGGKAASHLLKGQSFLAKSEYERAIAEFESARKLNSDLPRLHYSLGLGYFKLGRSMEALAAFENELRRTPRDFSTLYYLAFLREAAGDWHKARTNLDAALSIEPDSAEGNALLGKLLARQGKVAEAIKPLELAVGKDPDDAEKRYLLARAYQELGRSEDASRQFAEIQRLKREQLEKERRLLNR